MGSIDVRVRGGRKPVMVMAEGELVFLKKATTIGAWSKGIILPKEWLNAIQITKGKAPEYFTLTYTITPEAVLAIKPYFGEIPESLGVAKDG